MAEALITPSRLEGTCQAPPGKSQAHRLLICAALGSGPCTLGCPGTNDDIEATMGCLVALGATIERTGDLIHVTPIPRTEGARTCGRPIVLPCGESGSTLRFLLPVVCALGVEATLTGRGRLAERPIAPLDELLETHGITLTHPEGRSVPLGVSGRLSPGRFPIPGDVSSQYVSGLLLAAPLLPGPSEVRVLGGLASAPYVDITMGALEEFSVDVDRLSEDGDLLLLVSPRTPYVSPGRLEVEGDWSAAAFWLVAGALGSPVSVGGLDPESPQGDRAICCLLGQLGCAIRWEGDVVGAGPSLSGDTLASMEDTPDLVPPLAVACALTGGTHRLTGCGRLRLKESDRLETVTRGLSALGARIVEEDDDLVIEGVDELSGGTVDAAGDHRIAMMAAIASTRATSPVRVRGAQCVTKSYPTFWDAMARLGAQVSFER